MKKLDRKTFNILKVGIILVAVLACGIYYLLFYDDFCQKLPDDEISFEITIEEDNKKYVKLDEKDFLDDAVETYDISTTSEADDEKIINIDDYDDCEDKLKININTASIDLLQEISNVGPSIASNIIAYRETNGPFENIEDIMKVKGIGQAKYNIIKEEISIHD